jgi:hypothetical protein
MTKEAALVGREDVSRFVVHLTRDDRGERSDGASARGNLRNIVKVRTISALEPHCFFNRQIGQLPRPFRAKVRSKLSCVCLTEVPLNQLHLLTRPIPNRKIEFEPYGLVFTKEFIIAAGGQPAIYINGYNNNRWLHECVTALWERGINNNTLHEPHWRILPFINAMHERYDFTWEREWRVLGDLEFRSRDIVALILPSSGEERWKERLAERGIAAISPEWTYEQIVAELARQQRKTRSLTTTVTNAT